VRLHQTAVAAATAVLLAATPAAMAAGISGSEATQASAQAAKAVGKQTHASSVKVIACRRAGRSAVCHAEAHYTSGAKRCTFDITVTQTSAKGQRPRTSPSNFVCY
jgi:hypothetical protein